MKFLLLLFLVGCATANTHEALEEEAEYVYQEFMLGLEHSGTLKNALGYDLLLQAEDDIKTEMGKRLKETLDEVLEKMRDSLKQGKTISKDMMNKLQEIRDKMKELKVDLGDKAKEMLEKLRDHVNKFWKDLLDKLNGNKKRSIDDVEFLDWNLKEMFQKLRKALLSKIDKDALKKMVEDLFGKGSEMADDLLKHINEKGDGYKQKLLDFVDRYLGKKEVEQRSLQEYWEKIKEYFKNLHIELKEKYMKFGEWVKERFRDTHEKAKTKIENIKEIAKEFIDHGKGVSRDVAEEAREFLRPYRDDLGTLWDQVKETVKDILNKNN